MTDTATTAPERPKLHLEVLKVVKIAQIHNGLRHGDYQRYRQYCTRRLARVRKSIKFLYGKNKFQNKAVTPEIATDSRYLLVPLMKAERAWAHAMELREEYSAASRGGEGKGEEDADTNRKKFHIRKKLKKAAKHAAQLETLCSSVADSTTLLEAEAYAAWSSGNTTLEAEKWEEAAAAFIKASKIYENLAKIGDPDFQDLCKQKLEDIQPSVRYCNYRMGGGHGDENVTALVEMRLKSKGPAMDTLSAKLDTMLAEARKKQAESFSEITWKGQKLPVRTDKLRLAIVGCQDTVFELDKAEGEAKLALYNKLFIDYNTTTQLIRDEIASFNSAKDKSIKSEGQKQSLELLLEYITHQKLTKTIDRNLILVESFLQKMEDEQNLEARKRSTKPEDIVHLYENILQNLADLAQVIGKEDVEQGKQIAARILNFKAYRCFYMALSYSDAGKWAESTALLDRTLTHLQNAKQHFQTCASPNPEDLNLNKKLEARVRGEKCVAHAKAVLETVKTQAGAEQAKSEGTLLSNPDAFDSSFLTNKRLADFPPDFESIPCRPILFDTALSDHKFPSLEAKKKATKGGFFGGLSSFWRG